MYINHLTLSTGHCRRSPRAEVDAGTLALLHPWLERALAGGNIEPLPVAELSHFGARVIKDIGLVVTIYAPAGPHQKGRPYPGEHVPIATLGVAQRSRESAELWRALVGAFDAHPSAKTPAHPWCAVALHDNIAAFPDALAWLGDLERCVAWAWLTRQSPKNEQA